MTMRRWKWLPDKDAYWPIFSVGASLGNLGLVTAMFLFIAAMVWIGADGLGELAGKKGAGLVVCILLLALIPGFFFGALIHHLVAVEVINLVHHHQAYRSRINHRPRLWPQVLWLTWSIAWFINLFRDPPDGPLGTVMAGVWPVIIGMNTLFLIKRAETRNEHRRRTAGQGDSTDQHPPCPGCDAIATFIVTSRPCSITCACGTTFTSTGKGPGSVTTSSPVTPSTSPSPYPSSSPIPYPLHITPIDEHKDTPDIPTTFEDPVKGFRTLNLHPQYPVLSSLWKGMTWPPDSPMVAECMCGVTDKYDHVSIHPFSPHPSGSCGIYAATSIELLAQYQGVAVAVEGWGKVIEGEKGWRAEKARITAIYLPLTCDEEFEKRVREVADTYGVDAVSSFRQFLHRAGYADPRSRSPRSRPNDSSLPPASDPYPH